MYNSRPHLYYPQNYFLGKFLIAFIKAVVPNRVNHPKQTHARPSRRRIIIALILCFFVLPSLPIGFALWRNYQWEMSQPPTTVVPDLVGLDLNTAIDRARSAHLGTEVLGQTWYTDLSPGRVTLQSPDAGQHVPFQTSVGLELSIPTPAVLAAPKAALQPTKR